MQDENLFNALVDLGKFLVYIINTPHADARKLCVKYSI